MGKALCEQSKTAQMIFEQASDALHLDLQKLCWEEDIATLTLSKNAQPAILTTGYAMYRVCTEELGLRPDAMAGHSLGELTALTCAVLFFACIFIAPIAALIPPAVTSAALIYVGILMVSGLRNLDFGDATQLVPAALMLITVPISSSIGNAIGIAMISFCVIKMFTGRAKEVHWLTYAISVVFILKFFVIL